MPEVSSWTSLVRRCGSPGRAAGQVRAGHWQRVLRDAYVVGSHDAGAPETRAAAIRLLLSRRVALSHRSALWLVGLDVLDGDTLDVTVERGRHLVTRPRVRVHIAALRPEDCVQVGAIVATSAARAVVDLARRLTLPAAVAVGDAALREGITTVDRIEAVLDQARGLRGVVPARLALPMLNPRSQSPGESRLRVALHTGGLPLVDVQYDAYDRDGHVGRADLHVDGVWMEYDGRAQRLDKAVFVAERRRQSAVADLGFEIRRFTGPDVYARHPASLVAEMRRAAVLARGRDRGRLLQGPDTLPPPRQQPLPTLG